MHTEFWYAFLKTDNWKTGKEIGLMELGFEDRSE